MKEAKNTRYIPEDILRALIARSGGYCQNPKCNCNLFPFMADGTYKNIKEAAHIIPFSSDGPRGSEKRLDTSDDFLNIILLCPTCHTLIDKFPERYPASMLREWKENHETRLKQCFSTPVFKDKKDLRQVILPIFTENKALWVTYGPSSLSKDSILTDAAEMWNQAVLKTILPNNRTLLAILRANSHLLTKKEIELVEQFAIHKDGLEYNYLSGDKNSSVPRFPIEVTLIGKEEDHARYES